MGGHIRAFAEEDIPVVAQLRQECFRVNQKLSIAARCAYFEKIFFRNPWCDGEISSLVHQTADGAINGFLGAVPRVMLLRGQPIRVAVCTSFMVDPSHRSSLIGMSLLREFLRGPQDLSFTDVASPSIRKLWEPFGGKIALLYGLYWHRPLRPCRYAIHILRSNGLPMLLAIAGRSIASVGDALITQWHGGPYRPLKPLGSVEILTAEQHLECLTESGGSRSLWPFYEAHSLQWVIDEITQKKTLGLVRKVLVRNQHDDVVGWYVYFLNPGGISQVIQMFANKDSIDLVLDHLFYEAWERGVVALTGRLDPMFVDQISNKGGFYDRDGPLVLVHSRDPHIIQAIQNGNAFLTRMEGEWWMNF